MMTKFENDAAYFMYLPVNLYTHTIKFKSTDSKQVHERTRLEYFDLDIGGKKNNH